MDQTDLCFTPATQLTGLISRREISPVELTEAISQLDLDHDGGISLDEFIKYAIQG